MIKLHNNIVCFILIIMTNLSMGDIKKDEYIDPVIDMLLNGENFETQSSEDVVGDDPILTGGMWKCGNCTNIDDSKLVYSEVNNVDFDMTDDDVEIQIGLTLQGMRCVTLAADKPGVVRRLSGACDGETVTLHVSPAQHFVIQVYT